jgi:tellurite resistance protein
MSESFPESGLPLDPDELARLTEIARSAGNMPDFTTAAIAAMTAMHAQWYFGWINAKIPEQRAAEWMAVMIANTISST